MEIEEIKKQIQETLEPTLDKFEIVTSKPYDPYMAELRGVLGNMRFAYMVNLEDLGPDKSWVPIEVRINFLKDKIHRGLAAAK